MLDAIWALIYALITFNPILRALILDLMLPFFLTAIYFDYCSSLQITFVHSSLIDLLPRFSILYSFFAIKITTIVLKQGQPSFDESESGVLTY